MPKRAAIPFDANRCLQMADEILSRPPANPFVERVRPRGLLVARFALPLELLEPQNRRRKAPDWAYAKNRKAIFGLLWGQMVTRYGQRREPLRGRPQVIGIRFSAAPTDKMADSFKQAIDLLCVPKGRRRIGLGLITDDSIRDIDEHQRWEPAPRGAGFGYLEIRTGNENARRQSSRSGAAQASTVDSVEVQDE